MNLANERRIAYEEDVKAGEEIAAKEKERKERREYERLKKKFED